MIKGKSGQIFLEGELGWRNDFAGEWLAMMEAKRCDFRPRECGELGILARGARETWRGFEQLVRLIKGRRLEVREVDFRARGELCARAMFRAFGDRLAVRRDRGTGVCDVAGSRRGRLHRGSVVRDAGVFLVGEMLEVEGRERVVALSRCAEVKEEWLSEEEVEVTEAVVFDEDLRRVIGVKRRVYRGVVLEENRGGEVDPDLAGGLLSERVLAGDLKLKNWDGKVERWIARLVFLSQAMPELDLPGFGEEDRRLAIGQICAGAVTFKEVRDRDPWGVLGDWLSGPQKEALNVYAPEKIKLANGVMTQVKYEVGSEPWIEEKVQRLYGVLDQPKVAQDVCLVVKILAPNQRPWQVTSDLPGFWERGFEQMKKDLAGRYPKHDWSGARS